MVQTRRMPIEQQDSSMDACDVVVVGAGIGGAVLALALGRRGWKVKLLERKSQPPRMAWSEVLWGATPAALDNLGVGDLIRTTASVRLDGVEFWKSASREFKADWPDCIFGGAPN